jgi:Na+/H+ antiporter NhaC
MRPITDRLKISREKLSYIVDTTAAPVASLAPISTWIGYEVGLINRALESAGIEQSGYMVFLWSVPYRFYPILSLILVALIAFSHRDFGPMLRAERRARREGKVIRDGAVPMASLEADVTESPEGAPRRWYNAAVPLLSVIVLTGIGLWVNGVDNLGEAGWQEVSVRAQTFGFWTGKVYLVGMVLSEASANTVLCWSSLAGCLITVLMVVSQRILSLAEAMHAWLGGVKSMVIAIVVLLFAWSLGSVCADLHTAEFLTHALAGALSPRLLPVLVFVIACAISFATGTSYGTMAILMPLVIPIGHRLSLEAGFGPGDQHLILVGVVSSVLAGSVFGDHCSPISDTTIMSSMASACDHVDHVRTQLPYAVLVALVGMCLGDIPTAYGMSPLITIVGGSLVLFGVLRIFGKRVET